MEATPSAIKEANRLYWRTDRSVADIAETLGVSRRALYELVTPENAGATCDSCGGEVVYVNRSAKSASLARCPACGTECEISIDDEELQPETVPPYAPGWPRAVEKRASPKTGVGIVAGLAVGALLAYLIVRRRR